MGGSARETDSPEALRSTGDLAATQGLNGTCLYLPCLLSEPRMTPDGHRRRALSGQRRPEGHPRPGRLVGYYGVIGVGPGSAHSDHAVPGRRDLPGGWGANLVSTPEIYTRLSVLQTTPCWNDSRWTSLLCDAAVVQLNVDGAATSRRFAVRAEELVAGEWRSCSTCWARGQEWRPSVGPCRYR